MEPEVLGQGQQASQVQRDTTLCKAYQEAATSVERGTQTPEMRTVLGDSGILTQSDGKVL